MPVHLTSSLEGPFVAPVDVRGAVRAQHGVRSVSDDCKLFYVEDLLDLLRKGCVKLSAE